MSLCPGLRRHPWGIASRILRRSGSVELPLAILPPSGVNIPPLGNWRSSSCVWGFPCTWIVRLGRHTSLPRFMGSYMSRHEKLPASARSVYRYIYGNAQYNPLEQGRNKTETNRSSSTKTLRCPQAVPIYNDLDDGNTKQVGWRELSPESLARPARRP